MATLSSRSRQVPPSQKASYHQVQGAGKSRVKRKFMGLSEKDQQQLAVTARRSLHVNLMTEGSR